MEPKINTNGNLYCNKNILMSIVSLATKEVNGVHKTVHTFKLATRQLLSNNANDGVAIKFTKQGLIVDIHIVIEIGYDVNDVVYRVQQNVKNSIMSMVDLPIKAINVHIMDADIT